MLKQAGVFVAVAALVIAMLFGLKGCNDDRLREEGARAERARQALAVDKHITPLVQKAETVFVHDTVRLSRALQRWDTVYSDRYNRITDTIYVKEALATADTTIRACTLTVKDCGILRARQDTLIRSLRVQLANVPQLPGFFEKAKTDVEVGAVAIVLFEGARAALRVLRPAK